MKLRNSAKAVVVHDGRVLLTRCVDHTGEWYCFPGGGQEPGETLADAARRECLEETGAEVDPGPMLAVLEWHDTAHDTHAVEFYFRCTLRAQTRKPTTPDTTQLAVEWVELAKVPHIDLKPTALQAVVRDLNAGFRYLGLVD